MTPILPSDRTMTPVFSAAGSGGASPIRAAVDSTEVRSGAITGSTAVVMAGGGSAGVPIEPACVSVGPDGDEAAVLLTSAADAPVASGSTRDSPISGSEPPTAGIVVTGFAAGAATEAVTIRLLLDCPRGPWTSG